MAIIEGIPGLEVNVLCGQPGEPFDANSAIVLSEYLDEDEGKEWTREEFQNSKRSVKYLECTSEAEFQIRYRLASDYSWSSESLTIIASVDGNAIAQVILSQKKYHCWTGSVDGIYTHVSPTEMSFRPVKFHEITKVDTADSAQVTEDIQRAKRMGEICLVIHRTKVVETSAKKPRVDNGLLHVGEMSEKALKGGSVSHGARPGEAKILKRSQDHSSTYLDGWKNPQAIFLFKYRSREALQAELIIPRSPSPETVLSPLRQRSQNSVKREISPEERAERIAQLERELTALRGEKGENNTSIKREPSIKEETEIRGQKRSLEIDSVPAGGRAYKIIKGNDGGILVDLTDD